MQHGHFRLPYWQNQATRHDINWPWELKQKKRAWVKLSKAFWFEKLGWTGLTLWQLCGMMIPSDDFFQKQPISCVFFFNTPKGRLEDWTPRQKRPCFFSLSEDGLSYVSTSHFFLKLCFVCIIMELPTVWRCAQWKILMSMFDESFGCPLSISPVFEHGLKKPWSWDARPEKAAVATPSAGVGDQGVSEVRDPIDCHSKTMFVDR